MDLGLTGRVALVSAGSKGIGRAIAAELAAEGARVAISSRSEERAAAAASEIGAEVGLAWDTADVDGAAALVDEVESRLGGPVEVLVCNTGGPRASMEALGFPREEWEAAYRSLVLAPVALLERCIPSMRERGWGRVLNVVGTTVREPNPALMLSSTHRSAALAAWKTVASQVAADGVTLNSLLPGLIATDRLVENAGSMENAEAGAREVVPAGRIGRPDEMGAAAAFLCGDRAAYITGQAIAVDGGLLRAI